MARSHAMAAAALGAEITAVCTASDSSPNRGAFCKIAPHARHMTDGEELLADTELEGIVACLPWDVMPQWAVRLVQTPKPVLMEKPIGFSSDEARALVASVGKTATNKLVGYNRRFYETVVHLRERVKKGGLKAVHAVISESVANQIERHGRDIVPALVIFSSVHTLDLLQHLFGPVKPVALAPHVEKGRAAPFVSFNGLLVAAGGIPITVSLNADDPISVSLRCLFDDGKAWELSPLETLNIYEDFDVQPPAPEHNIRRYVPRSKARHEADASFKPGCYAQMAAFLSGDFGPGATMDDAVAVLDLIDSLAATAKSWPQYDPRDNNKILEK